MIEGSSKLLMSKKRIENSICFGSISLAAIRKCYSKSKKKYNGCFKEYIKLSCSFYFLNDIEYDRAGLVPSKKSFWFAWKSTLGRKYSIKHSCLVNPPKIRKKSISFLGAPEL